MLDPAYFIMRMQDTVSPAFMSILMNLGLEALIPEVAGDSTTAKGHAAQVKAT